MRCTTRACRWTSSCSTRSTARTRRTAGKAASPGTTRPVTDESSYEQFTDEEREALSRSEFAVCVATFYEDIAERLLNGAAEGFELGGVSEASVHTYRVPGAFQLPFAAKLAAESARSAEIVSLGVVNRGEPSHYD